MRAASSKHQMRDVLENEKLEVSHLYLKLWNVCGSRSVPLPCHAAPAGRRGGGTYVHCHHSSYLYMATVVVAKMSRHFGL